MIATVTLIMISANIAIIATFDSEFNDISGHVTPQRERLTSIDGATVTASGSTNIATVLTNIHLGEDKVLGILLLIDRDPRN